jgi:hypothetical protein
MAIADVGGEKLQEALAGIVTGGGDHGRQCVRSYPCWNQLSQERQHRTHADGNAVDHKNLLYRFRKAFSVVP